MTNGQKTSPPAPSSGAGTIPPASILRPALLGRVRRQPGSRGRDPPGDRAEQGRLTLLTATRRPCRWPRLAQPRRPRATAGEHERLRRVLTRLPKTASQFPKGSDLSIHSSEDLDWVAQEFNDRPRKRLA
jgi:hypothetical protein